MNTDIYTDGVINIALKKGMIRIEFGTMSISEKDDGGNPEIFSRSQLVLTPQVFLETFGNMERMLQQLIEVGVIRERDGEQRGGPARDGDATIPGKDRRDRADERRALNVEVRG